MSEMFFQSYISLILTDYSFGNMEIETNFQSYISLILTKYAFCLSSKLYLLSILH